MSNPGFLLERESIPVPKGLAEKLRDLVGIRCTDAALFLQQLHYWLMKGEGFLHTDKETNQVYRWIWNSYDEWRKQLPWWTDWHFRIIIKALREHSLIIFDQLLDHGRNRVGCYRLNYEHEWLKPLLAHHPLDTTTDAFGYMPPIPSDDCTTDITETTSQSTSDTTTGSVVEEENDVEEEVDLGKPTDEEVGIVCNQIRSLSPYIDLNKAVRNHIEVNWANVPAALAYIKTAIRTWKVKPDFNWTGLVVKALKTYKPIRPTHSPPAQLPPRPTPEQLLKLEALGEKLEYIDYAIDGEFTKVLHVCRPFKPMQPWWEAIA